jgi:hypothetical protein
MEAVFQIAVIMLCGATGLAIGSVMGYALRRN